MKLHKVEIFEITFKGNHTIEERIEDVNYFATQLVAEMFVSGFNESTEYNGPADEYSEYRARYVGEVDEGHEYD